MVQDGASKEQLKAELLTRRWVRALMTLTIQESTEREQSKTTSGTQPRLMSC